MALYTDQLQQFDSLTAVPAEQLEWLEMHCQLREFEDCDFISVEGDKIDGPHFMLQGHASLFMKQGSEKRDIAVVSKGDVFGYLPYSRSTVTSVFIQAQGQVKMLSFNTSEIRAMIKDHFELTQALVHIMSNRVRDFTALQQQNDKMAALGKLAAGLAHELNNPASALVSDSLSLRQHLRIEPQAFKELTALHLEAEQVDGANAELLKIMSDTVRTKLSLKDRSIKEDEIADWLYEKEIANTEEMSEIFTDFNIGLENLNTFDRFIPPHARNAVFNWILNVLVTEKMVSDIQISAARISELIKSVKIYTHLDRGADKIWFDIHDGIRNTLNILGHKFRSGNVELTEQYDQSLPQVKAYLGELNQVWTNLIDNALDSMAENKEGKIEITTERERDFVKVTITDNGPGIPKDIIPNIFDPFFTTKELGKGTGMGLETVRRIILKHKGSVKVQSEPGKTTFIVCIMINSDAPAENTNNNE